MKEIAVIFVGSNLYHMAFKECYKGLLTPSMYNGQYKTVLSPKAILAAFNISMPAKACNLIFDTSASGDVLSVVISDNKHTDSMRQGTVSVDGVDVPCFIASEEGGVALLITEQCWISGRKTAQYSYATVAKIQYQGSTLRTMEEFGVCYTGTINKLIRRAFMTHVDDLNTTT